MFITGGEMKLVKLCKNYISISIILFIILLLLIFYRINHVENILFLINFGLVIIITMRSKFSFFSIFCIVLFMPLISAFSQFNTGKSYGVLEYVVTKGIQNFNYEEMQLYMIIFYFIILIFLYLTNILEREKNLLGKRLNLSKLSQLFLSFLAIVFVLLIFPTLPFTSQSNGRFWTISLIPGNSWNHFILTCLIILALAKNKTKITYFSIVFVVFWFLSHYERVDMQGYLFLVLLLYLTKDINSKKISIKKFVLGSLIAFLVVYLNVFIGEYRQNQSISFISIITKIMVQNTATDIAQLYNSSINFVNENSLGFGKYLIDYLLNSLPYKDYFINYSSVSNILETRYYSAGGSFLLSQALFDFGGFGVVIMGVIYMVVFKNILNKSSEYRLVLWSFIISAVFRFTWYGVNYLMTATIYYIPFLYFFIKWINKFSEKNIN